MSDYQWIDLALEDAFESRITGDYEEDEALQEEEEWDALEELYLESQ